jgi:hypothetical protein
VQSRADLKDLRYRTARSSRLDPAFIRCRDVRL